MSVYRIEPVGDGALFQVWEGTDIRRSFRTYAVAWAYIEAKNGVVEVQR